MLLKESEFYDYRTAPVNGNQVVDLHRTGIPFYDDFLSGDEKTLNYLRDNKNLEGTVVMMSPEEYFKACSDYGFPGSHPSVEALKDSRRVDTKTLQHLKDVLTVYKKRFTMPMLNKADSGQEGLHRMMVIGDLFGWDHKVPVLVVDWADKQKAFEAQKRKRIEKIEYRIKRAVKDALQYKFNDESELKSQLQWELDKQFDYDDDVSTPVSFELSYDDSEYEYTVSIGAASYSFDYDSVTFLDNSDDDLDIDDLKLDDTEDFLKRYFGDDWRKTHPHLKDTFHIKESFDTDNIKQMDDIIQGEFGSYSPGDGCIFISSDGTFINIYPTIDDHEDLAEWLHEQGFADVPNYATWFVNALGYVRCRCSPHLCYIQLPTSITKDQYYSLEEWLEEKVMYNPDSYVKPDSIDIETHKGEVKSYDVSKYFPEEIIKIIKRAYASGKLYEKLK